MIDEYRRQSEQLGFGGTAKTSQEVARRLASCRFLRSALRIQGPDVARRSQARLRVHLRPGDPEVDVYATVIGYDRQLAGAAGVLSDSEAELYTLNAKLAALLEERREGKGLLRSWMVGLRGTVEGQFIAPDVVGLGLEKHTARNLDALVRQAERSGKNLVSDEVASWLGRSLFPRSTFDPAVHGEDLLVAVAEMKELQREIEETKRRRDAALLAKREAMASYDQVYLRTARMFEEMCRHAGKDELAERVRPSVRRRQSSVGEAEDARTTGDEESRTEEAEGKEEAQEQTETTADGALDRPASPWAQIEVRSRSGPQKGQMEPIAGTNEQRLRLSPGSGSSG